MRLSQKSTLNQESLVFNFLPARLCKNKSGWIVEYYVEHPISNDFIRVRKRVDIIRKRYKSIKEAELHIQKNDF